jgi:hypothetical protein
MPYMLRQIILGFTTIHYWKQQMIGIKRGAGY